MSVIVAAIIAIFYFFMAVISWLEKRVEMLEKKVRELDPGWDPDA